MELSRSGSGFVYISPESNKNIIDMKNNNGRRKHTYVKKYTAFIRKFIIKSIWRDRSSTGLKFLFINVL